MCILFTQIVKVFHPSCLLLFFAQFKSSTEDQLNDETTPYKKATSPSSTTSATTSFASMPQLVTPSTVGSTKSKRKCVVKSHKRNLKSRTPLFKWMIKVGTLVARTFKIWPCSRKPRDPPVPHKLLASIRGRFLRYQYITYGKQSLIKKIMQKTL